VPRQLQFPYPDPPVGFHWEDFSYVFNGQNTPSLGTILAAGQQLLDVPLSLQSDAPFLLREIIVNAPQNGLGIQFIDPFGNQLSDGFVDGYVYAGAEVEPAILCPAGAVVLVNLQNQGF
jgi:hypothetical protein